MAKTSSYGGITSEGGGKVGGKWVAKTSPYGGITSEGGGKVERGKVGGENQPIWGHHKRGWWESRGKVVVQNGVEGKNQPIWEHHKRDRGWWEMGGG